MRDILREGNQNNLISFRSIFLFDARQIKRGTEWQR